VGIWSSQAHPQQQARNERQLASVTGALWCAGVEIDWAACRAAQPRRQVPLPSYPFQRQSYWVEAGTFEGSANSRLSNPAADAFHVPTWKRTEPLHAVRSPAPAGTCTLVFGEAGGLAGQLVRHLRESADAHPVVCVEQGPGFVEIGPRHYAVRPGERADHEQLLRKVQGGIGPVSNIHHLWGVDGEFAAPSSSSELLERGFFSLLALAQALDSTAGGRERKLLLQVVTNRMEDVSGLEPLCPEKATLFSLAKVIGQEYPHIGCRVVDVVLPVSGSQAEAWLVAQLAADAPAARDEPLVAYRGPHRWVKGYEPLALPAQGAGPQQRLVQVTDIWQVGGEDDLPALCAHDAIGNRQKAVQVQVTVCARCEDVVSVLDYERFMRAGDEVHEDLVAFQSLFVAGVHYLGTVALTA